MKLFSNKIIGVILAVFSVVFMNSCVHDSCTELNCQNGAPCVDDGCNCPPGFEGYECQYRANSRFVGMYVGHSKCEGFPQKTDTIEIFNKCNPNQIILKSGVGNTSIIETYGTSASPEAFFESHEDENVIVNPYIRVDANQLQLTVISINKRDGLRFMCEFEGRRVSGTDTLPLYANPRFEKCD